MNVSATPLVSTRFQAYQEVVASVWQTVTWSVRAVGFWLAVIIPFLYLPVLYGGFAGSRDSLTFCGLLVLNVVALVVGHQHRR